MLGESSSMLGVLLEAPNLSFWVGMQKVSFQMVCKLVQFESEHSKPLSETVTMASRARFIDFPGCPLETPTFSGCSSKMSLLIIAEHLQEPLQRNFPSYILGIVPLVRHLYRQRIVGVNEGTTELFDYWVVRTVRIGFL